MAEKIERTQVDSSHGSGSDMPPFLTPDVTLMLLTWVTFFALLAILYKFAWKPILGVLDNREQSIKRSLEDVEKIKQEMERMDEKCAQLIAEAEKNSADIVERSRHTAREAALIIEQKAKEEAKITLENVLRDIKEESQKAQTKLRLESAQIAVDLAGKIIEENMTEDKNRKLINRFIKEI